MSIYTAIDPLALILPQRIYDIIAEARHPHEPAIAHVAEVAKGMSAEEKRYALARAEAMAAYAKAVQESVKAAR